MFHFNPDYIESLAPLIMEEIHKRESVLNDHDCCILNSEIASINVPTGDIYRDATLITLKSGKSILAQKPEFKRIVSLWHDKGVEYINITQF